MQNNNVVENINALGEEQNRGNLGITIGSTMDAADLAYDVEDWHNNVEGVKDVMSLEKYLQKIKKEEKTEITSDLTYLDSYRDDSTGLTIVVFKDKNGSIIVAATGTNSKDGYGINDGITDISLLLSNIQSESGAKYLADILKKYEGQNIILTGHSLGGGIMSDYSLIFDVPAITYNGAPYSSLWLLADQLLDNKNGVYRLNFISENDPLNMLVSLLPWNHHVIKKGWMNNEGGHSIIDMRNPAAREYMVTILGIEQGLFPKEMLVAYTIDANGDGIIDENEMFVRNPEQLIPYNLLTGGVIGGSGVSGLVKISSEGLEHLSQALHKLVLDDFGRIQKNLTLSQQNNQNVLSKREVRAEEAIFLLYEQLSQCGLGMVNQLMIESFDKLSGETNEGRGTRQVLEEIMQFSIANVENKLDVGPQKYLGEGDWFLNGSLWDKDKFIKDLKEIRDVATDLQHIICSTDETFRGGYGTGSTYVTIPFGMAITSGKIKDFFTTLPAKIDEVFEGLGARSNLMDGIPQALEKALETMAKNLQELGIQFTATADVSAAISVNFAEKDQAIAAAFSTGNLPKANDTVIPETYNAYLEESEVLADVGVLKAKDTQVEEKARVLSQYMTDNMQTILWEIKKHIEPHIYQIGHLKRNLESFEQEYTGQTVTYIETYTELAEKKEPTLKWGEYGPPTEVYEMEEVTKTHELESYNLSTLVGGIQDEIDYIQSTSQPIIDALQSLFGVSEAFLNDYLSTGKYMNTLIENSIYSSMGMSDLVNINKSSLDILGRIDMQLMHLNSSLMLGNDSTAITTLSQHVEKNKQQLNYLYQLLRSCFGDNIV